MRYEHLTDSELIQHVSPCTPLEEELASRLEKALVDIGFYEEEAERQEKMWSEEEYGKLLERIEALESENIDLHERLVNKVVKEKAKG